MAPDQSTYDTYIATLKKKYLTAIEDEKHALEILEGAKRRKDIYASTLKEEGVDMRLLQSEAQLRVLDPQLFPTNGNGIKAAPLSDTHAVYLAIRKQGNTGLTFEEIAKVSTDDGFPLSAETAKKVYWKQAGDKRMTKGTDGKVYLTKEGENCNKFRVQKLG
jgi:hypothetical protein